MSYKFARRSFLSSIGSTAMLLPLLQSIEARAQGLPGPKRLLVILKPVGVVRADYLPSGTPTPEGITSFDWRPISSHFEPLRSRLVLIDGLAHKSESTSPNAAGERNGGNETHEGGIPAMMCGVPCVGRIGTQDHVAGGPSIDQIFLKRSPFLGGAASTAKTPYGSLEVGTDTRADRDEISPRVMSYDDPVAGEKDLSKFRRPRYPEIRPIQVFDRLFAKSVIPDATPDQLVAIRAQKKSLLDFMRKDLTRLGSLVPASEKVKIDAHAEAIQKLETSINTSLMSTGTGGGTTATGTCTKPAAPGTFPDNPDYWYDSRADKATYHPHETVGRLHLQLIKAAFQCDLTRVATFMWSPGTNYVVFGGLTPGMAVGGHHVKSHGDGLGEAWLSQIDQWYAKTTSSALQEFLAPEDPVANDPNNTLLDNMVAVYASEVGRASHNWANIPTVVFGGKNLGIAGGRFMRPATARPFNDLWLALAPAFGINDMTRHGGTTQWTGPLQHLRKV